MGEIERAWVTQLERGKTEGIFRADLDAIPAHVMVNISRGWDMLRRTAVVTAVGLGGTVAVLGVLWGRQRRFSMKTLSGSGA